jgi:hypothetical protein
MSPMQRRRWYKKNKGRVKQSGRLRKPGDGGDDEQDDDDEVRQSAHTYIPGRAAMSYTTGGL